MTTFNAGGFLRLAIQSLVEQSHRDWELILVDNGSTDRSIETMEISDPRIRLITLKDNIGRTPALKLALEHARFPYVAILDADDVCHVSRLEVQSTFLDNNSRVVLVGSCVDVIDSQNQVTGSLCLQDGAVSHDALAERNMFVNSSLMYRREEALAVGGYDTRFEYAQDYHLTLKLAAVGSTHNLSAHLAQLRVLESSYTRAPSTRGVRAQDEAALFEFAATNLQLSDVGKRANRRRQAIAHLYLGYCALRGGEIARSVRSLKTGLLLDKKLTWAAYLSKSRLKQML
jgi:glycosyltransferase involved in cell wall biosynthesis